MQQETTATGVAVSYEYDLAGRRTRMVVTGQSDLYYCYDNADRLSAIRTAGSCAGTTLVGFGYDNADRRTTLTLPNSALLSYGYDDASQLRTMTWSGVTTGDLAYTYDAAGHRKTMSGSFARLNLPAAVTTTIYDANNRLTKWGNKTISYDNNGNMLGDLNNTYTWNARDQLTAVTKTGQTLPSFTYDAFSRRLTRTLGTTTTTYRYDGANTVQEKQGASVTASILTGLGVDEVFQRTEGVTVRSLITDALGSTLALADSAGAVQTSYTYAPYGETTTSGTASANSSQFTGRENDQDGLYYYRARYYHPVFSRFASEDPADFAGGDASLYGYVLQRPTEVTDPSGAIVPFIAACAVGAASAVATDLVLNALAGRKSGIRSALANAASGCISGLVGMGTFAILRPLISRIPLFRAVGQRELAQVLRSGNYGSSPSLSGKYFGFTESGVRAIANSGLNASRQMTITATDVPRWLLRIGYKFNDPGAGGAGPSIFFAERTLPILYRFMSSIRILGAP